MNIKREDLKEIKESKICDVEKARRITNGLYTGHTVHYGSLLYKHFHVEHLGVDMTDNKLKIKIKI